MGMNFDQHSQFHLMRCMRELFEEKNLVRQFYLMGQIDVHAEKLGGTPICQMRLERMIAKVSKKADPIKKLHVVNENDPSRGAGK